MRKESQLGPPGATLAVQRQERRVRQQKTHQPFSASELLEAGSRPPPEDPSVQALLAFGERLRDAGTKEGVSSCTCNTAGLKDTLQTPLIPHSPFFFLRLPQLQLNKCGPKAWPRLFLDRPATAVSLSQAANSIRPTFLASGKGSSLSSCSLYLPARFWPPRAACTHARGGWEGRIRSERLGLRGSCSTDQLSDTAHRTWALGASLPLSVKWGQESLRRALMGIK